jgi:hypothetical protein
MWFDSQQGQEIFLFSTASRPAMGSIKPPIHLYWCKFPPGVKQPAHETDHSPASSAEIMMCGDILHSLIHLHDMMLN